jgi:tetratricopeptide (TPR) repeat protein
MRILKASTYIAITLIACSCTSVFAATAGIAPQNLSHQEILTHLLKADLAMQRDMPDVALENYLIVAQYTHDAQVAQLATEIAVQNQTPEKASVAAEIWANAEPNDLQAQLVATTLFINSNPEKAQVFLNNAFNIEHTDLDQHLLLILNQLSPTGQKNLSAMVFKIAEQRGNDPYTQLCAAQIAAAQLDIDNAKQYVQLALKLKPELTSAIELNAKIISYNTKSDKAALAYLDQQVKKFPKNGELRYFYINALLDNDQTTKALPNLKILTSDKVYGGEAYITMGEIYIGQDNTTLAANTIKNALTFADSADKAKFYLGQLAEYSKDNTQAIKWYESVSENSEFQTQAYLRAAYIYSIAGNYSDALDLLQNANPASFDDQKQLLLTQIDILIDANDYDKALENANKVLEIIPDDTDFLYARSVVYGLQNNNKDAEKDLRSILALDPENANALNALGFTLSSEPARMNEAMSLIQQAISINPENPAYMDSMGWLLFKMGRTQDSITMLEKAYQMSGDNEIAAHLGEVLWSTGKKDAAKEIWKQGLASAEDNSAIHETMQRLNVPAMDLKNPSATNLKPSKVKAAN